MLQTAKNLIPVLVIAMTIIGCGGGAEPAGDLAELKKRKDSLKELKNAVAIQLTELETQIKLLDSASNGNFPLVKTTILKEETFKHYFEIQGIVESDQNANINAEVGAKILSIDAAEGDQVRKGQQLIRLDSRVLESNISEVKTQLELAQTVYNKQKSLWDQKIGSEIAYLEAESNLKSVQRRLETLNSQMDMYIIRAPFDGIVDEVFMKVGEMASPMAGLLRILNLDKLYIKADVSERYLGKIKVGDTSIIEFPSLKTVSKTRISRIGNFINPNNRTFKVRFELGSSDAGMRPNLLARIRILDYSKEKSLVIPIKVVQQNPAGEEFIFLVDRSASTIARKQIIKTGVSDDGFAEVLDGLKNGDEIVMEGGSGIKDGEHILVAGE